MNFGNSSSNNSSNETTTPMTTTTITTIMTITTITQIKKTILESMLECARPVVAAGVVDPAAHPVQDACRAVVKGETM